MVKPTVQTLNADTRRKILSAARSEFVAKGLAGSRTAAISELASVNKALINYYFGTKEQLYIAALSEVINELIAALHSEVLSLPDDAPLDEMLSHFVGVYLRVIDERQDFFRLFVREVADGFPVLGNEAEKIIPGMGVVFGKLIAKVNDEARAGNIRSVDPVHLCMNVMGMSFATFLGRAPIGIMMNSIGLTELFDKEFMDRRRDVIVETVLAWLSYKAPAKTKGRRK